MRFRITVRGEGTEIRGYATPEATVVIAKAVEELGCIVVASPTEESYNPFTEED